MNIQNIHKVKKAHKAVLELCKMLIFFYYLFFKKKDFQKNEK